MKNDPVSVIIPGDPKAPRSEKEISRKRPTAKTMKTTITVKSGRATRDEILACSLLLAFRPEIDRIYRRSNITDDVFRNSVVVGTGGRHNPGQMWLDQGGWSRDSLCATSLVLMIMGQYTKARGHWQWLRFLNETCGGDTYASSLRLTRQQWDATRSPVDEFALNKFSETKVLLKGDELFVWMKSFGHWLLQDLAKARDSANYVQQYIRVITVQHRMVLFMPHLSSSERETTFDLESEVNMFRETQCPEAIASVIPDDRASGCKLFRFPGQSQRVLDFNRLKNRDEITFARDGLAKTRKPLSEDDARNLLLEAMNGSEKQAA